MNNPVAVALKGESGFILRLGMDTSENALMRDGIGGKQLISGRESSLKI